MTRLNLLVLKTPHLDRLLSFYSALGIEFVVTDVEATVASLLAAGGTVVTWPN